MYDENGRFAMPALRGVLHVDVLRAIKLKDWGILFPAIRPYVRVICGGQTYQTEVQMKDRLNPTWNQNFTFNVTEAVVPAVLRVDIIHASKRDPRIVGTVMLQFDKMAMDRRVVDQPVEIKRKDGKVTGEIHVRLQFDWDPTRLEEINLEREAASKQIMGELHRPGVNRLWASGMDSIGQVPQVPQVEAVQDLHQEALDVIDPRTVPAFEDYSERGIDRSNSPAAGPQASPSDPPMAAWGQPPASGGQQQQWGQSAE